MTTLAKLILDQNTKLTVNTSAKADYIMHFLKCITDHVSGSRRALGSVSVCQLLISDRCGMLVQYG